MAATIPAAQDIARYGQHLPSLLQCAAGRDQGPALLSRLDDDDGTNEAADDAIPAREELGERTRPWQQFADQCTRRCPLTCQPAMLGRINHVASRTEDRNRRTSTRQRAAMCG